MNRHAISTASALILSLFLCESVLGQASTLNLNVPGPADWNTVSSWDFPFVPGDGFPEEIVGISNGGEVTLTSAALFPVRGVVIGESGQFPQDNPAERGTMSISGSGLLNVVAGDNNSIGTFRIGNDGTGTLNMTGGALNVANALTLGGAAESSLNLSGNAAISAGSMNLARTTRIRGPNVGVEVAGNLNVDGTFIAEITGLSHSTIDAFASSVSLNGTLRVEFDGHAPAIGQSWTLIDGQSVSGEFDTIDTSTAPALPRGAAYEVLYGPGGSGNVIFGVGTRLILTVDRASGATAITNAIGGPIALNGYDIVSENGLLSTAGWSPFETSGVAGAGWQDANPTANHLTELNLGGSHSIGVGLSRPLGDAYQAGPIRRQDEDLVFQYSTPDGRVLDGIVEYQGDINDMVLTVNPENGEAAISISSSFAAFAYDIKAYDITSASGSLNVAGWESFESSGDAGPNWFEANPTSEHVSELNLLGSTVFSNRRSIFLGNLFTVGADEDLVFQFATTDGEILTGTVAYGELPVSGRLGDTDGDDDVDLDDLNNVRNFFGTDDDQGDADHDGDTDLDDLNAVRNFFGTGGAQGVPEPSTIALAACLMLGVGCMARRRATP